MKSRILAIGITLCVAITVHTSCSNTGAEPQPLTPDTLLLQGSTWKYTFAEVTGWNTASFFDSYWSIGDSAFGNNMGRSHGFSSKTEWPERSIIFLRAHFTANPGDYESVKAKIAIDNGYVLYINETRIDSVYKDGYASVWDRTVTIPLSAIRTGDNIVCVKGIDGSWGTGFDMTIVGEK